MTEADQKDPSRRRRIRRQGEIRQFRVSISVDEAERAELESAASAEGLTISAFVAIKALAAARNSADTTLAAPLREALRVLLQATVQLQRAGTNLNQAVAALNSTGQSPPNLAPYARYTARAVGQVDQAVAQVRRRLP